MKLDTIKRKIVPTLRREGVTKAALFGSVVSGGFNDESDIDLVVNLKEDRSLLDLIGIRLELEEKLSRKVDVITYKSIHPLIEKSILDKQEVIYEEKS